ncbi:hypothetical protein D3C87_1631310 [compost metagenome]
MKLICEKLAASVLCMLGMATFTTNKSKMVMKPPDNSTARPSGPRVGVSGVARAWEEGRAFEVMSALSDWDRRYSGRAHSLIQFSCLCYYYGQ